MQKHSQRLHPRTRYLLARTLITLSLGMALASPIVSQPALAWRCPAGVLDHTRAYFGSNLEVNACSTPDAVCEDTFLFPEQRRGTAICSDGRWLAESEPRSIADPCPRFVFASGEVWQGGSYAANTCDAESQRQCEGTYFYRLPEGDSGYRVAVCEEGEWRPAPKGPPNSTGGNDSGGLRRPRSPSELEAYLQQGLLATYGGDSPFLYGPFSGGVLSPPPPGPAEDVPVSDTNLQEAGVDEADRIKSDGRHLYVLKNHQSLREPPPQSLQGARIRILEIDAGQPSATSISDLEVELEEHQQGRGLYLRSESSQVVVTASSFDLGWSYWYSPLAWLGARSTVATVDVTHPEAPRQGETLQLDGELVSSRRIDNVLYLATRFHPLIPGLQTYRPDTPEASLAIQRVKATSLSDLLPTYRSTADSEPRPLVQPWDCYLPAAEIPAKASDIVTLVAIDLDSMDLVSSKCFVGATETLYASPQAIYLASTRYDYSLVLGEDGVPWFHYPEPKVETDLHKFSLESGKISYRASGSVDGHLGWNILRRPFRLSERGDDLRAITYTDELTSDRSPVALTVLRDYGDGRLALLSRLPNEHRPSPIGKPGEQLYATRFVEDRAYLVTFLMTDPLYVLDLSRPEDPSVAGELEITGYSDYLHPIGDGYVLGVGKDAVPDIRGDFRGAWYQGIKLSLYDMRDPAQPFEADTVTIGKRGSEAQVLSDHHAFTLLRVEGENPRVAFGAVVHERLVDQPLYPWTFFGWSYSGLHLFEIDTDAGKIRVQGVMPVERYSPGPNGQGTWPLFGEDRSVLAGDAIFYLHGDDIYTGLWSRPSLFPGPR